MHAATSKPAQRAYLGTLLFLLASTALLVLSTLAFLLFYNRYVPHIGLEAPIHLQFHAQHPPHGTAPLGRALSAQQAYDVSLRLQLPRTPANRAVGNFMLDLALLAPGARPPPPGANASADGVLARARRPAILTYASPLVDAARTLAALPWFLLGWRRESETLSVPMLEAVAFARGADRVPDRARVVVEAATAGAEQMQFYEVSVRVRARFRGLRWVLYNYAATSFVLFTAGFYGVAMTTAFCVYVVVAMYAGSEGAEGPTVKREPGVKREDAAAGEEGEGRPAFDPLATSDLSDAARDFPTRGRQMPLRFPQRVADDGMRVKSEEEEALGIQPLGYGEADDEEDGAGASSAWRDSGIGTGRDDAERRRLQRRRRSASGD